MSPSSRRAGIEMTRTTGRRAVRSVALLTEGVDRNTPRSTIWLNTPASPSSRRAWIEITFTAYEIYQQPVALLTEGVDRNALPQLTAYSALHPGIANLSPIGLIVRGTKQKQKAA